MMDGQPSTPGRPSNAGPNGCVIALVLITAAFALGMAFMWGLNHVTVTW